MTVNKRSSILNPVLIIALSLVIPALLSFNFSKDDNGMGINETTVSSSDSVIISYTKVNATSFNQPDGSISILIDGGTPPYKTYMNSLSSDTTTIVFIGNTITLNNLQAGGYVFSTSDTLQKYTYQVIIIEDHK